MSIAQPLESGCDEDPFLLGPRLPIEMLRVLQTPSLATLNYVMNEVEKRVVQGLLAWNLVPVNENVFSKNLKVKFVVINI
jgi:hypothetical protein